MISIHFQYSPFITLSIKHEYYVNNLNRDVHFVPTMECISQARAMGVLIKNTNEGIALSYDVTSSDALLHYLQHNDSLELTFLLTTSNSFFVNLTKMTTECVGSTFYFNTDKSIEEDNKYTLHKGDFADESDRYIIVNSSFHHEVKESNTLIELYNAEGAKVFEKQMSDELKHLFNMGELKQGLYTVFENGKEIKKVVYQHQTISRQMTVAMITVSLNGKNKQQVIEVLERGEVLPQKEYQIKFDARATYWKYFIVSKYKLPLEKSGIYTNDKDIEFNGPEKVELSNGETAYLFETTSSLKLNERPKYNFKLNKSRKSGNSSEAYLNRLPVPSPESIKPESRSISSKVYSELIVYI